MLSTHNTDSFTKSTASPATLTYRKDIQGLRALAVLLVIAAHAKIPGFEGGFIGVDVFFVISGYLITGLLLKELASEGEIRFLRFYARRLKRLLPALALVVTTTAFISYQMLPTTEQLPQAVSAATAIFWVSNIHFAFGNLDYFGSQADQNVFLHTWSLGVEEQFYLAWPILLALTFWATRNRKYQTNLTIMLAAVAVISLIACIYQTSLNARLAFYLTPFRAWQFGVGGLVFLFSERSTLISKTTASTLSVLGLLLIIGSALTLRSSAPYPGVFALIPTIGAAFLIIAGGASTSGLTSKLMENRFAHGMGNISYSWYLWHWPIFILGGLFLPLSNPINQLLLILASGVLAYVTYHLFENPIRHSQWQANQYGRQIIAALILMSTINIGAIHWNNKQSDKAEADPNDWFTAVRTDLPEIYGLGCDDWFRSSEVKICKFGGDDDAQAKVVVFGDSIGLQWFPAIKEIAEKENWQLLVITKSACPMANIPFFYPTIGREYTECAEWRSNAITKIKEISADIVILGSAETYNFSPEQWQEGTESVLREIAPNARKIYFIRATPTLAFDGPSCLAQQATDLQDPNGQGGCRSSYNSQEASTVWRSISAATTHYQNVKLIDLNELVCPDGTCSAYRDGAFLYRDSQHLTATFIRSLSEPLHTMLEAQ